MSLPPGKFFPKDRTKVFVKDPNTIARRPPKEIREPTEIEMNAILFESVQLAIKHDQKGFFQQLRKEAFEHPLRDQVSNKHLIKFMMKRGLEIKLRRLNYQGINNLRKIYYNLRQCMIGWELELFVVYSHQHHPAFELIEKVFREFVMDTIH